MQHMQAEKVVRGRSYPSLDNEISATERMRKIVNKIKGCSMILESTYDQSATSDPSLHRAIRGLLRSVKTLGRALDGEE